SAEGLFTWGVDVDMRIDSPAPWEQTATLHQCAAWESGQDDLPNWDEAEWGSKTETLRMDAVDLNSYLVLDDECMGQIADLIGKDERADFYRFRGRKHAQLMNDHLWDDSRGVYADWLWDGRHSRRLAASNFLPLVAGVPSRERAERMVKVLTDPAVLWGDNIVPTISRDDPAFEQQQYWRGTVWPPMNYLLYEGLRRYGFDDHSAHLARRSVSLFMKSWNEHQLCRENFDGRSGEGGGQRHQSWGTLLPLTGVQELIDGTPWDGVRVGSLSAQDFAAVRNISMDGGRWDVVLSKEGLSLFVNGECIVETNRPIILYRVKVQGESFTAELKCSGKTRVNVFPDGDGVQWLSPERSDPESSGAVVFGAGTFQLRVKRGTGGE
ncbi:MAG: alpha,alpha-trehalase, partial [Gemmatimonadota bacterium]|nr:alpha,alpha-trehalase [Gemmatimonadota bacterium]